MMNIHVLPLERPHAVVLVDGEVHRLVASLIVSLSVNSNNELRALSYPIFEDGTVGIKPIGCTQVISRYDEALDHQQLALLVSAFTNRYPLARLSELVADLRKLRIKVNATSAIPSSITLRLTNDGQHLTLKQEGECSLIHLCRCADKTNVNDLLRCAAIQLYDLSELACTNEPIRVTMDNSAYEAYINEQLERLKNP
jgi:hypothetical protein